MFSPEEMARYRIGWQRRQAARTAARARRQERAWQVAREAARLLRETFGAEAVWVFGSLARGRMDEASDIDLAVSGLADRWLYRAIGQLQALDADFSIDLVRLEEASPSLRKRIEAEGIPL